MNIKHLLASLLVAVGMCIGPVWADELVDLNTATVEQLQAVNGIGEKTAEAIVAYRNEHGAFASVDDLVNVKGIGVKKLAAIRPMIGISAGAGENSAH